MITFDGKHLNDINEVDNIELQIGNKTEKLKLFFTEGCLRALNIFRQFLMTAFESSQQTVEIRNQAHQKWFEEVARYFIFQFSNFFSLYGYGSVNLDLFLPRLIIIIKYYMKYFIALHFEEKSPRKKSITWVPMIHQTQILKKCKQPFSI